MTKCTSKLLEKNSLKMVHDISKLIEAPIRTVENSQVKHVEEELRKIHERL